MLKNLPKTLTSYDILKSVAVILMVLDHTGHHFYPDEMWFRIFGRMCIPIWFFLIGYAKTTDVPKSWYVSFALLSVSAVIAGQYIFPLTIMLTFILMRRCRSWFINRALFSAVGLRGMFFILLFLTLPTAIFFEYGMYGMLFVILGFFVRHKEQVYERMAPIYLKIYVVTIFSFYYVIQGVMLPYCSGFQALVLMGGLVTIALWLWNFQAVSYSDARKFMAGSFIRAFQLMGRWTLEIYVAHVLIFRAVSMYLYPDRYTFMDWKFFPAGFVDMFL